MIAWLLAVAPQPSMPGSGGSEIGQAPPIALILILVLAVVVVLLIRSMNKHLRRVPKSFDNPSQHAEDTNTESDRPDQR